MAVRFRARRVPGLVTAACILAALPVCAQPAPHAADAITRVVRQFEQALATGRAETYTLALAADADRQAAEKFAASMFDADVSRAIVREQDRAIGVRAGHDAACVIVETFTEFGPRARVATCRLDLRKVIGAPGEAERWEVTGQDVLTSLTGLFRLAFDPGRAFAARGLVIEAEDLRLQWQEGTAFVTEAGGRPTGLVLVGKGEMVFAPSPASERGQMRIFAGAERLQAPVDSVYVRFSPGEFEEHVKGLGERQPADPREARRAEEVFREHSARAYVLDLGDLSAESWSLLPREGDFLAEIATRRFGTLTYVQSGGDAEDISLFDRRAGRNIAQYPSRQKLAARGLFYDEDAFADYRVTNYEVDARFVPDRDWMEGRAALQMVVTAPSLSTLVVRLADTLTVKSVYAAGMGRVMALRVRGQNSVVVALPRTVVQGTGLSLSFTYAGTIAPQPTEGESPAAQGDQGREAVEIELETSYLFSHQVYWYPQPAISSYATSTLRVIVPERYAVVASGDPVAPGDPKETAELKRAGLRRFVFESAQPLRYLACVISPLVRVTSQQVRLDEATRRSGVAKPEGASYDEVTVTVSTNRREQMRGRALADLSADILRFYTRLIGDCPYPSLNVALIERALPGGHSPAYMAAIHYVFPVTGITWRGDPANIEGFPEYFVAHELAHQWWGQAVGWKNYHEQWLSEGLAQYFAALYAARSRGSGVFDGILRQCYRWSMSESHQGPIYLGYRVGHIKGDSRLFRAVVYNKSAAVLHMLRRLIGDEAFFGGLRRFYSTWRFRKAGTDDLRQAFEAETGRPLTRFFERWIYDSTLPTIRFTSRTERGASGPELVLRFEQIGDVFDLPITVTIDYADGSTANIVVPVTEKVTESRAPLRGTLRRVEANRDRAALVDLR